MIITFFTILAWCFGVAATLLFILRVVAYFNYTELMQLQDNIRGQERTFPVAGPLAVMVVSFAWIYST